jgi:hypothetical protein
MALHKILTRDNLRKRGVLEMGLVFFAIPKNLWITYFFIALPSLVFGPQLYLIILQ